MSTLTASALPLPLLRRGKVREVYEVDADRLLLVASDRVSAFDVVLSEPIPRKGTVLTQMTAWWLRQFERDVAHHMISASARDIVRAVPALAPHEEELRGRAMLCRRTDVFPIECVMRGYISGSAWKEYTASGTLAGDPMPKGLRMSDRLDPPYFSPATKAETGHDENITPKRVAEIIGAEPARELERLTRFVYERGRDVAARRGIIIADTKFEFGRVNGKILLIDEVLTPDSSRFWPADQYVPGKTPPSFDKQPLRDWLDGERKAGRWNGDAPGPQLPQSVVTATSERYVDAFLRITGSPLTDEAGA